jgi:hypothetical protein
VVKSRNSIGVIGRGGMALGLLLTVLVAAIPVATLAQQREATRSPEHTTAALVVPVEGDPRAGIKASGTAEPSSVAAKELDDRASMDQQRASVIAAERQFDNQTTWWVRLLDWLAGKRVWLVIVVLVFAGLAVFLLWWRWQQKEQNSQDDGRMPRGHFVAKLDAVASPVATPRQHDPLEVLERKLSLLSEQIQDLQMRTKALESGLQDTGPQSYEGSHIDRGIDQPSPIILDRRNTLGPLFEDSAGHRARLDASDFSAEDNQFKTAMPAPSLEADLVSIYNEEDSPAGMDRLAKRFEAEFFTNERTSDLSALIKSDVDRFWLVQLPGDRALLVPGLAVRKAWPKYRQASSDHPLAHHFELVSGDRFVLHRPARLQRDSDGNWQMVERGQVGGVA